LVELLAVIATIATLSALLLPILGKAKVKAQQATCLSNLRQLGFAWELYYGDNAGYLVESYPMNNSNVWVTGDMSKLVEATNTAHIVNGKLFQYNKNTSIYRCPADRGAQGVGRGLATVRSFSMNGFMGGRPPNAETIPPNASAFAFFTRDAELERQNPSQLWVLLDEDEKSINDGFFVTDPLGRVWYDFPAISSYRHNFSFALNFADGHAEIWSHRDARTRSLSRNVTEQSGNSDLRTLAATSTARR
jgi:Tfp pilus assembly major pilin PilA